MSFKLGKQPVANATIKSKAAIKVAPRNKFKKIK